MRSRPSAVLLGLLLLVLVSLPARADTWGAFRNMRVVSAEGRHYLVARRNGDEEILHFELCRRRKGAPPLPAVMSDPKLPTVEQASIDRDPADELLAFGTYHQLPLEIIVLDRNPGAVLFEARGRVGRGTSLAVVGVKGQVRWQLSLDDILSVEEQAEAEVSISSTWWFDGFWVDESRGTVVLFVKGGLVREVSLADGSVNPAGSEVLSTRIGTGPRRDRLIALSLASTWEVPGIISRVQEVEASATEEPLIRLHAAVAVLKAGRSITTGDLFLECAKSESSKELRHYALAHLGEAVGEAGMSVLANAVKDEDPGAHYSAVEGLTAVGDPAVPVLAEILLDVDEDGFFRADIAEALGEIGTEAALVALAKALVLEEPEARHYVREGAAKALARFGPRARVALPSIGICLRDADPWVREAAAEALGSIGEAARSVVPALVICLRDEAWRVRMAACAALGKMGSAAAAAVPELRRILKEDRVNSGEAAFALGAIGPAAEAAIPDLVRLVFEADKLSHRFPAAAALARLGGPGLTLLSGGLADEDAERRLRTVQALSMFRKQKDAVLPLLRQAAKDEDERVRDQATEAILALESE